MDKIDQQIGPQILDGNISPDDMPQEFDYWTVEDFEDLLLECAQTLVPCRASKQRRACRRAASRVR